MVAIVVGAAFALAWRNGYFLKISGYVQETRDELKKCTWPDRNELIESTTVVFVAIALLGTFTIVADILILTFIRLIS